MTGIRGGGRCKATLCPAPSPAPRAGELRLAPPNREPQELLALPGEARRAAAFSQPAAISPHRPPWERPSRRPASRAVPSPRGAASSPTSSCAVPMPFNDTPDLPRGLCPPWPPHHGAATASAPPSEAGAPQGPGPGDGCLGGRGRAVGCLKPLTIMAGAAPASAPAFGPECPQRRAPRQPGPTPALSERYSPGWVCGGSANNPGGGVSAGGRLSTRPPSPKAAPSARMGGERKEKKKREGEGWKKKGGREGGEGCAAHTPRPGPLRRRRHTAAPARRAARPLI